MKAKTLVIDTGALLTETPLWEYGETLCTVDEVISELRDKKAIQRLEAFPVLIKRIQPAPKYIREINEVSKKTGDYASLSIYDIKVLALTLQQEVEAKGTSDHLQFNPEPPKTIFNGKPTGKAIEGFYSSETTKLEGSQTPCQNIEPASNEKPAETVSVDDASEDDCYESAEENDYLENNDVSNMIQYLSENMTLSDENSSGSEDCVNENEDEESDEGWITPSNITKKKKSHNRLGNCESDDETDETVDVACVTSDFAMQNVLKHIKLNVMSSNGKLIKELRSWILRCYACYKTTSNMSKIFCPKCGNKTLKRVGVTVNPDGTQKLWISTRRAINTKGMVFSLPKPRGGKHAANPYLTEDQRFPDQRSTKRGLKKCNPLDPDYDAGDSPFAVRDIYSRSGQLGLVGGKQQGIHYWERKNPNVPMKSLGKKKRSKK